MCLGIRNLGITNTITVYGLRYAIVRSLGSRPALQAIMTDTMTVFMVFRFRHHWTTSRVSLSRCSRYYRTCQVVLVQTKEIFIHFLHRGEQSNRLKTT